MAARGAGIKRKRRDELPAEKKARIALPDELLANKLDSKQQALLLQSVMALAEEDRAQVQVQLHKAILRSSVMSDTKQHTATVKIQARDENDYQTLLTALSQTHNYGRAE